MVAGVGGCYCYWFDLILFSLWVSGFDGHEFVAGVSGVSRKQQFENVLRGGGGSRWL